MAERKMLRAKIRIFLVVKIIPSFQSCCIFFGIRTEEFKNREMNSEAHEHNKTAKNNLTLLNRN